MLDNTMTIEEVADALGLCSETVKRMLRKNIIKGFKVSIYNNSAWKVMEEDLDTYISTRIKARKSVLHHQRGSEL